MPWFPRRPRPQQQLVLLRAVRMLMVCSGTSNSAECRPCLHQGTEGSRRVPGRLHPGWSRSRVCGGQAARRGREVPWSRRRKQNICSCHVPAWILVTSRWGWRFCRLGCLRVEQGLLRLRLVPRARLSTNVPPAGHVLPWCRGSNLQVGTLQAQACFGCSVRMHSCSAMPGCGSCTPFCCNAAGRQRFWGPQQACAMSSAASCALHARGVQLWGPAHPTNQSCA